MIIKYKYGFCFNGMLYGYKTDKILFRFNQILNGRQFSAKEIHVTKWGFHLYGKRYKTIKQVKSMLVEIDRDVLFP